MKYHLIQKVYPGDYPRPSVEAEIHKNENLIIISAPWGDKGGQKLACQTIRDYFNSAMSDPEATSPFPKLSGLSTHANSLRIAAMLANNLVFQKFNYSQYSSGCELLAMSLNHSELSWIHFGQPHILLFRENELHSVQAGLDLGFQFKNETPLPEKLLGLARHIDLETRSMVIQPGDKIVLLVRSSVPGCFFSEIINLDNSDQYCQKLFDMAVDANTSTPFWIGVIEFPIP